MQSAQFHLSSMSPAQHKEDQTTPLPPDEGVSANPSTDKVRQFVCSWVSLEHKVLWCIHKTQSTGNLCSKYGYFLLQHWFNPMPAFGQKHFLCSFGWVSLNWRQNPYCQSSKGERTSSVFHRERLAKQQRWKKAANILFLSFKPNLSPWGLYVGVPVKALPKY